ncbi:hypothetical protein M5X00_27500 [Paenibacillus alvei]|uniref:hypothetical protein n=1 Tax=Paenibacillus alvei TaxID=44250 RepID=UPI0022806969|nr:hypothetical protein [Paenibacillus alvei]MCY9757976.1 hypothetical protein [Paenibacillus alvei]
MKLKPGDLPVLTTLFVPTGDREVFVSMDIVISIPLSMRCFLLMSRKERSIPLCLHGRLRDISVMGQECLFLHIKDVMNAQGDP